MKTWLNCVFWNIQDARHPKQKGVFTPQQDEKSEAKKARETREANNRDRAPNLADAIVRIARYEEIDLFLFAEYHLAQSYEGGDATLCAELERKTGRQFSRLPNRTLSLGSNGQLEQGEEKSIVIFSSLEQRPDSGIRQQLGVADVPDDPCAEEPFDESRLTLRYLYLPGEPEPLLLASVHLVSKRYADTLDQREEARRIARRIRFAEQQVFGNEPPRTVLVGDFNMNPWEEGMRLPDAFRTLEWFDFENARPPLAIWGKDYPYFYNPTRKGSTIMTQPITSQPATTLSNEAQAENLWPELATMQQFEPPELPVDVLQAQARYLAPRTEYLLKGFVRSSNLQSEVICHSFYVYAPYVREEPFKTFFIKHGVNLSDGITLIWGDMGSLTNQEYGTAHSVEELRAKIKELLADENMLHLIGNLLALSKKAKADEAASAAPDEDADPLEPSE